MGIRNVAIEVTEVKGGSYWAARGIVDGVISSTTHSIICYWDKFFQYQIECIPNKRILIKTY